MAPTPRRGVPLQCAKPQGVTAHAQAAVAPIEARVIEMLVDEGRNEDEDEGYLGTFLVV